MGFVEPPFLVALFVILLTLGLIYLFYPALSIALIDSTVAVTEECWSPEDDNDNDVFLSVVIPAFNEQDRLPVMLDAALNVVLSKDLMMEWVVVSDGSTDQTGLVVRRYAAKHHHRYRWKLVTLRRNRGKGAAVKQGMLRSVGRWRLMADADGATDFAELWHLLQTQQTSSIVFGSRAHLQNASKAQRSVLRTFLMHAFHFFVRFLCKTSIRDTQCGFKLFSARAAQELFGNLHLQRWAFDIELVVLCGLLGYEDKTREVAVKWREVEGSKLDSSKLQLALVSLGMLRDMICVRLCYTLGIWKARKQHTI